MFDLVSTAVAVITARYADEVIDIEGAAVSHLNVGGKDTTVWHEVKAGLPGYVAVSYCRMSTIQPTGSMSATPVDRCTCSRHSSACSSLETKPARTKSCVTLGAAYHNVAYLPVSTVQALVILTFWKVESRTEVIRGVQEVKKTKEI